MRNILYAPWRAAYARSTDISPTTAGHSCVFCIEQTHTETDEKQFIIHRGILAYVMLNLYPYNAGHMLIVPYEHRMYLYMYDEAIRAEIINLIAIAENILMDTLKAHAINIGGNIGRIAGAGIPDHLHMHVLPRWQGDTNFMPTLMNAKQISFDLHEIYQGLRAAFQRRS